MREVKSNEILMAEYTPTLEAAISKIETTTKSVEKDLKKKLQRTKTQELVHYRELIVEK